MQAGSGGDEGAGVLAHASEGHLTLPCALGHGQKQAMPCGASVTSKSVHAQLLSRV